MFKDVMSFKGQNNHCQINSLNKITREQLTVILWCNLTPTEKELQKEQKSASFRRIFWHDANYMQIIMRFLKQDLYNNLSLWVYIIWK